MNKIGILCNVYRNTGSYLSPVWVAISRILNTQIKPNFDKQDASDRGSRVKREAKTMLGLEVTGKCKVKDDDEGYLALYEASLTDECLDLLVLNGPIDENGVHGWRADWLVTGGDEDQGENSVLYMDFTLTPGASEDLNPTQRVTITGGIPVYDEPWTAA